METNALFEKFAEQTMFANTEVNKARAILTEIVEHLTNKFNVAYIDTSKYRLALYNEVTDELEHITGVCAVDGELKFRTQTEWLCPYDFGIFNEILLSSILRDYNKKSDEINNEINAYGREWKVVTDWKPNEEHDWVVADLPNGKMYMNNYSDITKSMSIF